MIKNGQTMIHTKKIGLFGFLVFWGLSLVSVQQAQAQQDVQFTQYMFNGLAINPAYAGSRDVFSVTGLFRTQWTGIEGAPVTQTLSGHLPIVKDRIGLGLTLVNDKIGITNNFSMIGSYAFRIRFNTGVLAMGIQAAITQFRANFTDVRFSIDPTSSDPAFDQDINKTLPNFGTGLYYYTDRFYAGLSVPQLINWDLSDGNISSARQSRHIFATAGYVFDVSPTVKIRPSLLAKYVSGAPFSVDVNANVWLFDRFALGASYRVGDAVNVLAEARISNNISVGYAYDLTLTELRKYNSGSHEIMLRVEFGVGKDKTKILTPRYF
jgi:type IX secretion system PorP/SprF family membrane protein